MSLTQFFSHWIFFCAKWWRFAPKKEKRKKKKCWHLHFFGGQICDVAKVVIIHRKSLAKIGYKHKIKYISIYILLYIFLATFLNIVYKSTDFS